MIARGQSLGDSLLKPILLALVLLLAAGVAWAQLVPGQGPLVPKTGPPCGMSSSMVPNCGPMVPNVVATSGYPMPKWSAAKAAVAAGSRNALLAIVGSSMTSGAYADGTNAYNNAQPLAYGSVIQASLPNSSIQTIMGTNGIQVPAPNGWASYDARTVPSANWITEATNSTIGASAFGNPTDAGALAFTPANSFDSADVYYPTSPGLGVLALNVDGGTTLTTINQNVAASFGKTTVTFALGTHTFNFVRSSGNPLVSGVVTYNSAVKTINMFIAGWNGGTAANFSDTSAPFAELNALVVLAPDLVVLEIGANDWINNTATATVQAQLQTIINALRPTSDILIVISVPSSVSSTPLARQAAMASAIKATASANSLNVIDIPTLWVSWTNANANGWMANGVPGLVHPNSAGYAQMGAAILPFILR